MAEPERIRPVEPPVVHRPVREIRPEYTPEEMGTAVVPGRFNLVNDRVRWGPVFAGFFVAITTMVMLGLLGLGIGLTGLNAGVSAAQGAPPPQAGTNAAIWGAVSAIIAFLIGGYVAGRTAAVYS